MAQRLHERVVADGPAAVRVELRIGPMDVRLDDALLIAAKTQVHTSGLFM